MRRSFFLRERILPFTSSTTIREKGLSERS
jgi:hypothetical protein